MKTFMCLVFICVIAFLSPSRAMRRVTCVDITVSQPCDRVARGMYEICNMCDSGYFAICSDSDSGVRTMSCPFTQDANGQRRRMLFDQFTQSCEVESESCSLQQSA